MLCLWGTSLQGFKILLCRWALSPLASYSRLWVCREPNLLAAPAEVLMGLGRIPKRARQALILKPLLLWAGARVLLKKNRIDLVLSIKLFVRFLLLLRSSRPLAGNVYIRYEYAELFGTFRRKWNLSTCNTDTCPSTLLRFLRWVKIRALKRHFGLLRHEPIASCSRFTYFLYLNRPVRARFRPF